MQAVRNERDHSSERECAFRHIDSIQAACIRVFNTMRTCLKPH